MDRMGRLVHPADPFQQTNKYVLGRFRRDPWQARTQTEPASSWSSPMIRATGRRGLGLVEPEVGFVKRACLFGVTVYRVTEPGQLSERTRYSLNQTEPVLPDVPTEH